MSTRPGNTTSELASTSRTPDGRSPYVPRACAFQQTDRDGLEGVRFETWDRFGEEGEKRHGVRRKTVDRDQGIAHAALSACWSLDEAGRGGEDAVHCAELFLSIDG